MHTATLLKYTTIVIFFSHLALPAQDLGSCRDILLSGVHNTYQSVGKSDVASAYRAALCNENSSNTGNSSGTGGGASYAGFGVNVNHESANTAAMHSKYCSGNQGSMSSDDLNTLITESIDPVIVTNWRLCMTDQGKGLFANIDANGEAVIVTAEWRGAISLPVVVVKGNPQVSGLACDNTALGNGTSLDLMAPATQLCKRIGTGPATFVFNTDHGGSRTLKLPSELNAPVLYRISSDPNFGEVLVTRTPGAASLKLQVELTAIPWRVPAGFPPPPDNIFHRIKTNIVQLTPSGMQYLPEDLIPEIHGTWAAGTRVRYSVEVPNIYTDTGQGYQVSSCFFRNDQSVNCIPTSNILAGSRASQ